MDKDKLTNKTEQIIQTAFEKWSESLYTETSLSIVADSLGMSKPALYRYFQSKENLYEAMIDRFLSDVDFLSGDIIDKIKELPLINVAEIVIKKVFLFFIDKNHHYYFRFFMSPIIKEKILKREVFNSIYNNFLQIVSEKIDYEHLVIANKVTAKQYIRFVFYLSVAIYFNKVKYSKNSEKRTEKVTEQFIDEIVQKIIEKLKKGVFTEQDLYVLSEQEYVEIENNVIAAIKKIPPKDKLFEAITAVIARDGVIGASMENIALQMGFSGKSSLYSHFKSREQMFKMLFDNESASIISFIKDGGIKYENLSKNLYGYIISTWSYFVRDKNVLQYFDWLHYQMIKNEKNIGKSQVGHVFHDVIDFLKQYSKLQDEADMPIVVGIGMLSVYIIRDIVGSYGQGLQVDIETIKNLRQLYMLFIKGLQQ